MEKVLIINGREVPFKSTGAFLLRYKAQFQRDGIADMLKLSDSIDEETGKFVNYDTVDLDVFFKLIWTLAKTANPQIQPMMEWLDTFDEFPLAEIIPELMDIIQCTMKSSAKKSHPATAALSPAELNR